MSAREIALGLPEVSERETWGHPTFRIGEKMFTAGTAGSASCWSAWTPRSCVSS